MTDLNEKPKKFKVGVVFSIEGESGPLIAVFSRNAQNNKGNIVNNDEWYDLPGGKRDFVPEKQDIETIEEAAIREINEELGVKICPQDIQAIFANVTHQHVKTPTTLSEFVLVKCPENQLPRNVLFSEHAKLEFVPPNKATELLGDRIPQKVQDYLTKLAN